MAPNLEAVEPIVVPTTEPAPIDLAKADALLQVVQTAKSTEAADNLATLIKEHGMQGLKAADLVAKLTEILNNKGKSFAPNREGALQFITSVCTIVGAPAEPFLLELLPLILGSLADNARPVQIAAKQACEAFGNLLNPNMIKQVLPMLLETNIKWQVNEGRLKMLNALAQRGPRQMARCMPDVIPPLTNDMWDLKAEVKNAAKEAMSSVCNSVDNRDVIPFIPRLIEAMEHPEKVKETVYALASTTFVQTVECAALSIISPLLIRGFAEKETAMKRQCARIVENMTKLVDEPTDVAPFLPKLLPILAAAKEEVSDPECREVCGKAYAILQKKGDTSHIHQHKLTSMESLLEIVNNTLGANGVEAFYQPALKFICNVALSLYGIKVFETEAWRQTLLPYLLFLGTKAEQVVADLLAAVLKDHTPPAVVEEDQDVEELCNCNFSLAYGNKILLNNTNLKLKRGYRYGLVGRNDSGKTSLMRAIANGKVDGFPPPTELRTVFVETDIQGELSDLSVLDYIYADERLRDSGVEREEMASVLQSVGFNDQSPANITTPVGALSGGWKMKLALARAMLLRADILLLDEPTNHLDVHNVKWVENYLVNLKGVTCIMVSHDSGLLDRVCTHIIQISDLKLHLHKGNLSEFVAANPDAKSYFELASSKQKFSFPQPGPLPGITSKGKAIMRMDGVTFTYPGRDKATLTNITVRCSLSSRVAVLGVNGAGKSTLIKLLTGELEPQSGDVWKHPNCRFAYVAQHAFHHIENHLDMTPNQYIRWRYEHGNDKEALQKVTVQLTKEEEDKMKQPINVEVADKDGNPKKLKLVVKRLTEGRREMKKEIEYEVEWENYHEVTWISQKKLLDNGFEKILKQIDDQIALRATLYARPLTTANVEKHLEDVGLEREFGTHTRMRALSGGQKVKVVLAAAMWNQPHILILDEPTNYLDRDSLGALSGAIREFEGGVVMITHNHQFCTALCPEVWVLENGTLDLQGDAEWMKQAMNEKIDAKQIDEVTDAFGNVSKVKGPKKELSRAEKKKLDRKKKSNKRNGIAGDDDDDEDW